MQPAPPTMPPSQPLQPLQTPILQYQNQHYPYNQPRPPLPIINDLPLQQQVIITNKLSHTIIFFSI